MEKEFIPYEQALALKELGFDEPCMGNYNTIPNKHPEDGDHKLELNYCLFWDIERLIKEGYSYILRAPTFSQAFRWFRENHSIYVKYIKDDLKSHIFSYKKGTASYKLASKRNNYEEAEFECLKKLIEIVKSKL